MRWLYWSSFQMERNPQKGLFKYLYSNLFKFVYNLVHMTFLNEFIIFKRFSRMHRKYGSRWGGLYLITKHDLKKLLQQKASLAPNNWKKCEESFIFHFIVLYVQYLICIEFVPWTTYEPLKCRSVFMLAQWLITNFIWSCGNMLNYSWTNKLLLHIF